MKTRVVNIHRERADVYIGRRARGNDGTFGNPFAISENCTREQAISKFRTYLAERIEKDPAFKREVESLRGKSLGCFCKPLACHGDVYVEYLEGKL